MSDCDYVVYDLVEETGDGDDKAMLSGKEQGGTMASPYATWLPIDGQFQSRKEATNAMKAALFHCCGLSCGLDKARSNCRQATYRCTSALEKSVWKGDKLEEFGCKQQENESAFRFKQRRNEALEDFACKQSDLCPFKAVAVKFQDKASGEARWKFKMFNGLNLVPHHDECLALCVASGSAMTDFIRERDCAVSTLKRTVESVAGGNTDVSALMLPSKSTIYRAKLGVRDESDAWYNQNWARLERYLLELQQNPDFYVKLVKDGDRFSRYFVLCRKSIEVLHTAGLDFYAIDACHTRHHIAKGMKLHLLVGRNGSNQNVFVGWSLDSRETKESYAFFAAECRNAGFGRLACKAPAALRTKPVLFSDMCKGLNGFVDTFDTMHHAYCAKHLADYCRTHLRSLRRKGLGGVSIGFANAQIYAMAKASSHPRFMELFDAFRRSYPHAAEYLSGKDPTVWTHVGFGTIGVASFGHITSNAVEGSNGVIREERALHPFQMTDKLVTRTIGMIVDQGVKSQELLAQRKVLTPFARQKIRQELDIARSRSQEAIRVGPDQWAVTDMKSKFKIRHHVDLDPSQPSCSPCDTWSQFRLPCRHMLFALLRAKKNDYLNDGMQRLAQIYCHPAYLVENFATAYNMISFFFWSFRTPWAPFGTPKVVLFS